MLNSIKTLINALDDNNILYCHWKSNEHLDKALEGDTDLDVLFDPKQRNQIEIVLCQCGLKRFRATPQTQYNAIEDFIGLDDETAKIWHLHTHYKMTLGMERIKEYTVTPWTSMILNNRIKHESGIYCSSIEYELVLLVVRMTLKLRFRDYHKHISKHDKRELCWLIERVDMDQLAIVANVMVGEEFAQFLKKMISDGLQTNKQLKIIHPYLKKRLSSFTGYSNTETRLIRTKREIFSFIGRVKRKFDLSIETPYRRISPSGGLLVSFVGFKTTDKNDLLSDVKREFKKKIDVTSTSLKVSANSKQLGSKAIKSLIKSRNNGILVLVEEYPVRGRSFNDTSNFNLPDLIIIGPGSSYNEYFNIENAGANNSKISESSLSVWNGVVCLEVSSLKTYKEVFCEVMSKIWTLI